MNRTIFLCLSLVACTTVLSSQATPVPLTNLSTPANRQIGSSQASATIQSTILDNYGKLPLSFEANRGQTDSRVKFLSRTRRYSLFLTANEAVLTLSERKASTMAKMAGTRDTLEPGVTEFKGGNVLRMKLRNANPTAKVTGTDELTARSNYFIGNDPAKWHRDVPTYAKVRFEGIYTGIDLVYYGNQGQLEYDFVVAPGADLRRIQFDVRGAERIRRNDRGDLVLKMGEDEVRWHKPVVYQQKDGERHEVDGRYDIKSGRVRFDVADYDPNLPLTIDPVLVYSTYLGGSDVDTGMDVVVDSNGAAYVSGETFSIDFPEQNAIQSTNHGGGDAFYSETERLRVCTRILDLFRWRLGGLRTRYRPRCSQQFVYHWPH